MTDPTADNLRVESSLREQAWIEERVYVSWSWVCLIVFAAGFALGAVLL